MKIISPRRSSITPTASLRKKTMNPWQYPQSAGVFFSPVSSHYAQAYLQNSLGGFPQQTQTQTSPSTSTSAPTFQPRPRPRGSHGCTHDRCTFSGSQKAVEIHMMDRHLIYPPNHKNKQRDWDADPSLKGHVFSVSHEFFTSPPSPQRVLTFLQKAHRHPGNQRNLEHA